MELVKNKVSGKSFIVLEDMGGVKFLGITPEGRIKLLERHLFGPQMALYHKDPRRAGMLTKTQMDAYSEYCAE